MKPGATPNINREKVLPNVPNAFECKFRLSQREDRDTSTFIPDHLIACRFGLVSRHLFCYFRCPHQSVLSVVQTFLEVRIGLIDFV